jgi:DNA-binding MarR family transcriptional regulator
MQQSEPQQEGLGLLIAAARRRIKQAVWNRVEQYGLTPQQFWVMVGLFRRGDQSLHDIATRIRSDDPTASRIVSGLVKRGLVASATDPEDRRRSLLRLTAEGKKMAEGKLMPIADEIRKIIHDGVTADEREITIRTLRKVIANAERLGGKP